MKSALDILKEITAKTKKTFWVLGLYAFWVILFLIFMDFVLGGFVLYKYVFSAEQEVPKITETILKFDIEAYDNVLKELQTKEQDSANLLPVSQFNNPEQLQNN